MRKIKIAQIGTNKNSHGNNIWASLVKNKDVFDVIGYAMPENEREKFSDSVGAFNGYKEMTVDEILNNSEIEAVTIETEEVYLTKYAMLAAEHGKHIHMEKPGSTSLVEFEKLIEVVKKSGQVFHTGYMYRYNPCVMKLMKDIKAGEFGKILSVEAQMNILHPVHMRKWLNNFPGGMMFFLGCHLVDLILQIKGIPDNVIALNRSTGLDSVESSDFGMAVFEYPDGVSFAKAHDTEIGGFARRQLVVIGEKKSVEIKPLEMFADGKRGTTLYTEVTEYTSETLEDMGEKSKSEPYDRYDTMMLSFAEMVRGEKKNPWSYNYELELYKTILKSCGVKV